VKSALSLLLLAIAALGANGLSQAGPPNLDFKSGTPGQTPPGWFVPSAGFAAEIRHDGCRSISGCAILMPAAAPAGAIPAPFGNLMQSFAADAFRGKTVVLRAWIRVEKTASTDRAQMWLRVDRPGRQMGFFDNMGNRPITSPDWQSYEISGDVEPDAVTLNIGVMSLGKARVWIDDVSCAVWTPSPQDIAARDELQQIYARIDLGLENGHPEELAAHALPDAQMAAGPFRQPLSVAVAELKDRLAKGTKIANKTTVTSVRLSGDTALAFTQSTVGFITAEGRRDFEQRTNDTWVRGANGWKLKESFEVFSRAVAPKFDPESVKPVVAELKQRAVPLATVEAGARAADLAAFGKAVGDARLVALGEASHGTREFFQMKHRLLEYLVKEKGFTVFAIEGNWPESLTVDRYIKTGEGNAEAGLAAMYFWTWQTEEVREMIQWMRAFNQAPGKHSTLTFTSFDMQFGHVAAQRALEYLKQYSPADAPAAETAYADVSKIDNAGMSSDGAKGVAEQAAGVLKIFDSKRAGMEKASSPQAWRDARQAAAIVLQSSTMRIPGKGGGYRDEMMAKNVEWLADEVYPHEKIVLWAHNFHVSFGHAMGEKSMGTWLKERFGRSLYVTGFAFRRGQLRAVGSASGQMKGLAAHDVPPAPEGSGDAVLSAAGLPLFFLNMSGLPPDSQLRRWLAENRLYYDVGAVWQTADAEANLSLEAPARFYDGLIFVEEGHAARTLGAK